MLKSIQMNKKKVEDIVIGTIALGLFISYFYIDFLALPFVAGLFIGRRFVQPILLKEENGK